MSHQRHISTASSYAPVLINPTPRGAVPPQPSFGAQPAPTPRHRYPLPLPLLACVDLGYTLLRTITARIEGTIVALAVLRWIVLCVVLGCSKRWRTRGGWVAVVCGFSVGFAVWTTCKAQLEKGAKGKMPHEGSTPTSALFLGLTAGMAIVEYLTFLLLLRLSPPHHRSNPLSLQLPHSAVQSPTAFAYHSEIMDHAGPSSPGIASRTSHFRHTSRHSLLRPGSVANSIGSYHDDADDEDDFDAETAEDSLSDTSSISESSIIDLPPPMAPSRIAPSSSVNRGLDIIAAIDQTPVLGAVVRRTRSARFLGQSWGSRTGEEEGYGTFEGDRPAQRS